MSSQPYLEPMPEPDRDNPYRYLFLNTCKSKPVPFTLGHTLIHDPGLATDGLFLSVLHRNFEFASQLLALGVKWDPKIVQHASRTIRGAKWLIDEHFDVNTGFPGGLTVLCFAVSYNTEDVIRFLLSIGANPKLGPLVYRENQDMKARSVENSPHILNTAAAFGTPEALALLLSHGADIKSSIPLHSAAGHGWTLFNRQINNGIPMMEYLVDTLGLDVNASDDAMMIAPDRPDRLGQVGTPLDYAIKFRRDEEAKWLRERGAETDKREPFPTFPIRLDIHPGTENRN